MALAEALAVAGALAFHALAGMAMLAPWPMARRAGQAVFAAGFAAAAGAWGLRLAGGHLPLQSLYDVFLTLAAMMWPLSMLCRRLAGPTPRWLDPLGAAILLAPVMFVFSPDPSPRPPALDSWLFVPHVGAYVLAYVLLLKASVQGAAVLAWPSAAGARERAAYRLTAMGFPLMTVGLVLGAWWGRLAWGGWWNWDPKELWSLASWLAFVLYLHVRPRGGLWRRRVGPALLVAGGVLVVVTLLWANLSARFGGLHTYAS